MPRVAFKYAAEIKERCDESPVAVPLSEIGSFQLLAGRWPDPAAPSSWPQKLDPLAVANTCGLGVRSTPHIRGGTR